MRTRLPVALACTLAVLLLSGCLDVEYRIVVDRGGGADISYRVLMDKKLMELSANPPVPGGPPLSDGYAEPGESGGSIEDLQSSAEDDGFQVTPLDEGDKTGFVAWKHVDDLAAMLASGEGPYGRMSEEAPVSPGMGLEIRKGLLGTEYVLDEDVDMSYPESSGFGGGADAAPQEAVEPGEGTAEEMAEMAEMTAAMNAAMMASMAEGMRFTFVLGLPVASADTNATKVERGPGGLLMTWDLVVGERNRLSARASSIGF